MNITKKLLCVLAMLSLVLPNAVATSKNDNTPPVAITNFLIYEKDARRIIEWAIDGKEEANYWKVQRSSDKVQFSTIALILGSDPKQAGNVYQYREKISNGKATKYYYRLCHVDVNGNEQFSEILEKAK
jgi:hypothetical protein